MSTLVEPQTVESVAVTAPLRRTPRVELFGAEIDVLTRSEAVAAVRDLIAEETPTCHFVVTPNVDHVVMLQEREDLRDCYRDASLVLADGWPIVSASRVLGRPLPERVAGSDLVPALFSAATPKDALTVFLLGAAPGVAEVAAKRIQARWPAVQVVGTYSPPLGFERDPAENQRISELIADVSPKLLVVGLGAPKQELWVHQHRHEIQSRVALCVGATIDFLAEHRRRAPDWMQRIGLEWLHRLASEPRRLARRYGRDAIVFPQLVASQWRRTRRSQ